MVLKYVLLFLFIFGTSFNLNARTNRAMFKKAQYQYKKKRYKSALVYLRKSFNLKKTRSIPSDGLYLLGVTYKKLGSHKRSVYYLNYLIKKKFRRTHKRAMIALKKDDLDDEFRMNALLKATYFHLSQSYLVLYKNSGKNIFAANAKRYLNVCDNIDYNDKCSDYLEQLTSLQEFFRKSRKSYEAFFYLGQFYLQDRVTIKEDSSGTTSELIANNLAYCYGGGLRYGNAFNGYFTSGCVYYGTATVAGVASGAEQDNNYSQDGVPIAGIYVDGGYYKLLDDESTRLSLSFPVIYRAGTYTNPEDFSITNSKDFNYGISAGAGMKFYMFELESKLSHLGDSNLLMLNLIYNL